MNIQAEIKNFTCGSQGLAKLVADVVSTGADMSRIPFHAKMRPAPNFTVELENMVMFARGWLRQTGLPVSSSADFKTCDKVDAPHGAIVASSSALLAESQFVGAMGRKDAGDPEDAMRPVFTSEDKDPAILWQQALLPCITRWLVLLTSSSRWEILQINPDTLTSFYREWCNMALPRSITSPSRTSRTSTIR